MREVSADSTGRWIQALSPTNAEEASPAPLKPKEGFDGPPALKERLIEFHHAVD
jgi:hypothetical protein